jgi:hypothetical protein
VGDVALRASSTGLFELFLNGVKADELSLSSYQTTFLTLTLKQSARAPRRTPLPLSIVFAIFALLPVDARLRCREVCCGWRAVLRERSLWLRLDLSKASGGLARPATDALLLAAAEPAGGQLRSLDVCECEAGVTHACLLAVVTANAGALRELRTWRGGLRFVGFYDAQAMLGAAPQLRVLDADVTCESVAEAHRLLRNEGAFAPLRLHKLKVVFDTAETEASALSLAEGLAAHSSLVDLYLLEAPLHTPAALDAIVAVALANRFSVLALSRCRLSPASAPALARLLGGDTLRCMRIWNDDAPLLDAAAAQVLGDALHANSTLHELLLLNSALWRNLAAAVTLLGAATGHRSLREVSLFSNPIGDAQDAAGAALGALVAADAPTLLLLDTNECGLQEAALGPLVDALPANTHLHTLLLGEVTATAAFLRERLLPAVRANTSLKRLAITVEGEGESDAREAQEIVNSRAAR